MQFFPPTKLVRNRLEEVRSAAPAAYFAAMRSPQFTMGLRYLDLRMRRAMLHDPMSVRMMARTRTALDFTPRYYNAA
ncbi:MAG TPA: hypothetical protein VGS58_08550 [Candidatus Sulfopaludibacter sp.]|nr:hypothetical protein [Candidatus Sulfopaludibacter sp.]